MVDSLCLVSSVSGGSETICSSTGRTEGFTPGAVWISGCSKEKAPSKLGWLGLVGFQTKSSSSYQQLIFHRGQSGLR